MTPFLTILSGCVLGPVIAALVVGCLCSRSILRQEKPPWSYAPFSVLVGLFGSLWLMFRGEVLHPAGWPDRIPGQWHSFVAAVVMSLCVSQVVALVAVDLFQRRYRKHLSVSERQSARRQRRITSQRRTRWVFLLASGTLIAGFSTCLVLCLSGEPAPDVEVVDGYWDPANPPKPPTQDKPASGEPPKILPARNGAVYYWPIHLVGLLASGCWFAYTIAYWRGNADWRVKWN